MNAARFRLGDLMAVLGIVFTVTACGPEEGHTIPRNCPTGVQRCVTPPSNPSPPSGTGGSSATSDAGSDAGNDAN